MPKEIEIRECTTIDELAACVQLQRDVFALPEIEISPVRHLIVTKNAGGFTLGAFSNGELVGFVLSVPAFLRGERAFYSHMTAVRQDFQGQGVGASLKWAQRERSLAESVKYIKWTFEPVKARNAYFNLEKLGAVVRDYAANFYGTDYSTAAESGEKIGLASDRLFAEWALESEKVTTLAAGNDFVECRARPQGTGLKPRDPWCDRRTVVSCAIPFPAGYQAFAAHRTDLTIRSCSALYRPRLAGRAALRRQQRQRPFYRPDLLPPRWDSSGDRAGCGSRPHAVCGADLQATRRPLPPVDGWGADRVTTPADVASADRLELRPARGG